MPVLLDEFWGFFFLQVPGDAAAVADLVIRCSEKDVPLPEWLGGDLPVQRPLVRLLLRKRLRLDGQQQVKPQLLELPKNGFWVWRASAWISTPPRSSSLSSIWSTARSWSSPEA